VTVAGHQQRIFVRWTLHESREAAEAEAERRKPDGSRPFVVNVAIRPTRRRIEGGEAMDAEILKMRREARLGAERRLAEIEHRGRADLGATNGHAKVPVEPIPR
jgi:hypothetical protein